MCFYFLRKEKKRPKRLTKYQILSNVLPVFDDVGISRREHSLRGYAETYNVKVMDTKSLDDSLFLAKRSINNFLRDLSEAKRGFKYNLLAAITLKRCNNVINMYDIQKVYIRSDAMTVTNQRFILNAAYEKLKIRYLGWSRFWMGS